MKFISEKADSRRYVEQNRLLQLLCANFSIFSQSSKSVRLPGGLWVEYHFAMQNFHLSHTNIKVTASLRCSEILVISTCKKRFEMNDSLGSSLSKSWNLSSHHHLNDVDLIHHWLGTFFFFKKRKIFCEIHVQPDTSAYVLWEEAKAVWIGKIISYSSYKKTNDLQITCFGMYILKKKGCLLGAY